MERGFAKNVKIDVCCADFLRSSDTGIKEFRIHERAVTLRLRPAWAKTAMQIAYVRDFDIDAVHLACPGFVDLIIRFAFYLQHRNCFDVFVQLAGFLDFLERLLGMFGSRYSQKL